MTTYNEETESTKSEERLGQILSIVSAKGGSGKTILSATLAYALLQAGMKVVTIDTDFSTRGLSLYLLGSLLESNEVHVQSKHCLYDSLVEDLEIESVTPLKIIRGQIEYHVVISNKDVWEGGEASEMHLDPYRYCKYLYRLCERFRKEYDYVVIDTRGGFDDTSAAPGTISDGYVMVVEADMVSIEQVRDFKMKMDRFGRSDKMSFLEARKTGKLKGFIINKAIFSADEKIFPRQLARLYDSKTFGVIPLDKDANRAYQNKSIPQEIAPDSDFSCYSLRAIERIVSPSINWPSEAKTKAFYKFSRSIESAFRARKAVDMVKQAVFPHLLIVLLALATIFYLLFKKGSVTYSLRAFLLCAGLFALVGVFDAMVGSLSFLRSIETPRKVRMAVSSVMAIVFLGFVYLALFDLPKTFSQEPLLKRIDEQEKMIAQQKESYSALERGVSALQADKAFLTNDRDQAQKALNDALTQNNVLESQSVDLRTQVAKLQRDKSSVDTQLDGAMRIMTSQKAKADLCQSQLDECQKRIR